MNPKKAYKIAREKLEQKHCAEIAELDRTFRKLYEYGILVEDTSEPFGNPAPTKSTTNIAQAIRQSIDTINKEFSVKDVLHALSIIAPDLKLRPAYVSSVLYRLVKGNEIETVDKSNRKTGFLYKKKGPSEPDIFK